MPYSTRAHLELVWGKSNIDKWADANNNANATQITARVAWALARASDKIDNRLRGVYTVPFATTPTAIEELNSDLAGVILYQSPRGIVDGEDAGDLIAARKEEIENAMTDILAGFVKLDAPKASAESPRVYHDDCRTDWWT